MRKILGLLAVVVALGTVAMDAEAARRLGGGKSSGMQREAVTAPAAPGRNAATPGQPGAPAAAPATAGAAAAAAPAKRSWMGPIAGLAAGLGLAALASHFGFGEGLANFMMVALLVMAALALVGFLLRKRAAAAGGPAMAGAGAPAAYGGMGDAQPQSPVLREQAAVPASTGGTGGSLIGSRIGAGLAPAETAGGRVGQIPAGFDVDGFVRNAKEQFVRLQAANDAGDLSLLRGFLTPQMFEEVRADIASRDATPQKTEVFGLDAQVLEVVEEGAQYVASVRFSGAIRDQAFAPTEDFVEVWHLVKPREGAGGWLIAGIQQG